MGVHLTDNEIKGYLQHNLAAKQLLSADLHLSECKECSLKLLELNGSSIKNQIRKLQEQLGDISIESDHASYDQLELYVDGKLDDVDQEIVQSHLEVCVQCSKEKEDLQNFRLILNQPATKETGKVISWHKRPVFGTVLKLAGAAAMIALFVWAAALPMRDRINKLKAELESVKKENSSLTVANTELQTEIASIKASQLNVPVIASLKDSGKVVSLDQQGNISGLSAEPHYLQLAKEALTKQRIQTPKLLAALIGKQGSLLGESTNGRPFDLIAPIGTLVAEDRPNFQWDSFRNATGYRVSVYDKNFKEIVASDVLKKTEWSSPRALQRGEIYNWIVTAYLPDREVSSPVPPAPEARFKVLDAEQYLQLQQAKQNLAQSHLLSGLAYAQLGLLDESERELQQLVGENPDSKVAKDLLARVQSLRKK